MKLSSAFRLPMFDWGRLTCLDRQRYGLLENQ